MNPLQMTVSISYALSFYTNQLEAFAIEDAQRNIEWMLMELCQCHRAFLYGFGDTMLTENQLKILEGWVERRINREPLQYILGKTDFYNLTLKVAPGVLIPRPETEQVVEEALKQISTKATPSILDIGTGSGCIALALKHERPDATVYACDVSETALHIASQNAQYHKLPISFHQADVLAPNFSTLWQTDFDLVISNPPYIPFSEKAILAPEVATFEPALALFTDENPLLFYEHIAHHAKQLLKPNGILFFETHEIFATDVATLLTSLDFISVTLKNDLAQKPRMVWGRFK